MTAHRNGHAQRRGRAGGRPADEGREDAGKGAGHGAQRRTRLEEQGVGDDVVEHPGGAEGGGEGAGATGQRGTPPAASVRPSARARPGRTAPEAVGRRRVRAMRASASRSSQLLRAAAPATAVGGATRTRRRALRPAGRPAASRHAEQEECNEARFRGPHVVHGIQSPTGWARRGVRDRRRVCRVRVLRRPAGGGG